MASNFRISIHRNCENQHLKLSGDFDGSSAWQLLNMLKKTSKNIQRIIVHTSCLNNIYAFGLETFHQNLSDLKIDHIDLLFTGEYANKIFPQRFKNCAGNIRVH